MSGDLGSETARLGERFGDGLAVVDAAFAFRYVNPRFARLAVDPTASDLPTALGIAWSRLPTEPPAEPSGAGWLHRLRLGVAGKHLELALSPWDGDWLCVLRDISLEVGQREKLLAIQRAGRELSRLTADELARMSTAERVDLLKANIVQYSQQLLDFHNLEIRLLDKATGRLNILLSEGVPGGKARELSASTSGNGITGFVAATGVSYLCPNVETDPHYLPGAVNAKSSLTVPITGRDGALGVFNVESDRPNHFTESDREYLEVFAHEIAQAVETLELLQVEKRLERSAAAEAILDEVGVPVDAILSEAVEAIEKLGAGAAANVDGESPADLLASIINHANSVKQAVLRASRAAPVETAPAWAARLTGKRVLVVDADLKIRQLAYRLLARLGCEAYTVGEAREAVGVIRSLPYDVVVADAELPDVNGFDLFLRVRELRPTLPFVLMKGFGYDANHTLVKARQAGLRVFLYKPFRIDRLAESLEDALFPGSGGGPSPANTRKPVT
jgi:CheY-like chemotaxis protein